MNNPLLSRGMANAAWAAYKIASENARIDIDSRDDKRVVQAIGDAPASKGYHAPDGTLDGHEYTAAADLSVRGLIATGRAICTLTPTMRACHKNASWTDRTKTFSRAVMVSKGIRALMMNGGIPKSKRAACAWCTCRRRSTTTIAASTSPSAFSPPWESSQKN